MDFSISKLLLVGMVSLVVLGPKKLPEAARYAGRLLRKARNLRDQFLSDALKAHEPFCQIAQDFKQETESLAQNFNWSQVYPPGVNIDSLNSAYYKKEDQRGKKIQMKSRMAKSRKARQSKKMKAVTGRMRPGYKF